MATELNVAHRNAVLDARGAVFNGGAVDVRSGARPGADAGATGTLLVSCSVGTPAFGSASTGQALNASPWVGVVAATGAPGYYRLRNSAGTQITEGDAAEAPGSGEAMIIDGLVDGDLIEGGTLTIDTGDYAANLPAGDSV